MRNDRRTLLAACAALPLPVQAKTAADTPIDVFLIAGQSNASGIPGSAEGSPRVPSGAVLQFYGGRISAGNDPVGNAEPGSAWPGRRVLFVPAAVPSSSLLSEADIMSAGHWDRRGKLLALLSTNVNGDAFV